MVYKVDINVCGYYRFKSKLSSKEKAIEKTDIQAKKINSGELKIVNYYLIGTMERDNELLLDYCFLGKITIDVVAKNEIIADKRAIAMLKNYNLGVLQEIRAETYAIKKQL